MKHRSLLTDAPPAYPDNIRAGYGRNELLQHFRALYVCRKISVASIVRGMIDSNRCKEANKWYAPVSF